MRCGTPQVRAISQRSYGIRRNPAYSANLPRQKTGKYPALSDTVHNIVASISLKARPLKDRLCILRFAYLMFTPTLLLTFESVPQFFSKCNRLVIKRVFCAPKMDSFLLFLFYGNFLKNITIFSQIYHSKPALRHSAPVVYSAQLYCAIYSPRKGPFSILPSHS